MFVETFPLKHPIFKNKRKNEGITLLPDFRFSKINIS